MTRKADDFKKDIIFRAIEWGFGKFSFKAEELFEAIGPTTEERDYLQNHFIAAGDKTFYNTANRTEETIFYTSDKAGDCGINTWNVKLFSLTVEAKFKYIDFLELEQARKNSEQAQEHARNAQKNARISIKIAIGALVISAVGAIVTIIPLFLTS